MIKNRMERRGQGGFTLIELLVVIAILGILAGVVVFAVSNITKNAKDNACKIEKRTLQTAVEAGKASSPAVSYTAFLEDNFTTTYWTVDAAGALHGKGDNSDGDCAI